MPATRLAVAILISIVTLAPQAQTLAQTNFMPFRTRVEADPKKRYDLTDSHGPWLIMAGSFSGSTGERIANALALEIRRELRMPAYVYRHHIDLEESTTGLGWQAPPDGQGHPVRQQMKLLNLQDFDEIAVLVGEFDSHDSSKIQKALGKIKEMQPKAIAQMANPNAPDAFRQRKNKMHFNFGEEKEQGPLRAAFITPNPLIPEQYFNPKGPDRFVYELNKDLEFSLLQCKSPFTLRVATFKGDSTFDLKEIDEKKNEFNIKRMLGQPIKSKLSDAAENAHRLTLALRERGVEAYEFHDRYSSYVCVGSFNTLTVTGPDGREQWNPQLVNLTKTFQPQRMEGVFRDASGRTVQGAMKPFTLKGLDELPFDMVPEPIEVPRYSVARDYIQNDRQLR